MSTGHDHGIGGDDGVNGGGDDCDDQIHHHHQKLEKNYFIKNRFVVHNTLAALVVTTMITIGIRDDGDHDHPYLHQQACGAQHLGDRCEAGCSDFCPSLDRVLVLGEDGGYDNSAYHNRSGKVLKVSSTSR